MFKVSSISSLNKNFLLIFLVSEEFGVSFRATRFSVAVPSAAVTVGQSYFLAIYSPVSLQIYGSNARSDALVLFMS